MANGLEIGEAVELMRSGQKVRRAGWNGKGMWIYLIQEETDDHGQDWNAFVCMRTAQGTMVPWLCSQTDLLATDWEIAE